MKKILLILIFLSHDILFCMQQNQFFSQKAIMVIMYELKKQNATALDKIEVKLQPSILRQLQTTESGAPVHSLEFFRKCCCSCFKCLIPGIMVLLFGLIFILLGGIGLGTQLYYAIVLSSSSYNWMIVYGSLLGMWGLVLPVMFLRYGGFLGAVR